MTTVWVVLKDGAVVGVFTSREFANAVALNNAEGDGAHISEVLVNRVAPTVAPKPKPEAPAEKPAPKK